MTGHELVSLRRSLACACVSLRSLGSIDTARICLAGSRCRQVLVLVLVRLSSISSVRLSSELPSKSESLGAWRRRVAVFRLCMCFCVCVFFYPLCSLNILTPATSGSLSSTALFKSPPSPAVPIVTFPSIHTHAHAHAYARAAARDVPSQPSVSHRRIFRETLL